MGPYVLIHVLEPARAAQYAALVERRQLSATPARSVDEALFHLQRLGPPALILTEVRNDASEFDFLRTLRKAKQTAPALVISGSWRLRAEAHRLRKQLGVVEVLAPSQPLPTVEKAVARALDGEQPLSQPPVRRKRAPVPISQPPPAGPPSFPPMPLGRALRTPLAAPHEAPPETLPEVLARTARSLRASMVLLWLDEAHGGGLHGHFGWEADLVPMVGTPDEWAPFRRMAASAPVLVQDAVGDKVLSHSPLVASGMVGSFAGAPLVDMSGDRAGVLWIVHSEAHGLVPDVLAPLTVWAQHIGAELPRLPAAPPEPAPPAPEVPAARKGAPLPPAAALEAAALALEEGLIVSDSSGRIAASNRAALKHLGLRNRRLTGLSRERLLERLRLDGKLDLSQAERLGRWRTAQTLEVKVGDPARILRWVLQPLLVDGEPCVADRIDDVTQAREQQLELDRLVRMDALTWLGNRKSFDEWLATELSRALRSRTPLSLVLLAVDGREGLDASPADRVLRSVAWVIADLKRGYDHAARIDGGTLAVILPGAPAGAALKFAERIAHDARELEVAGLPAITLSGGVAQFDMAEDVDTLVARARAALQEAASFGGNGIL